MKLMLLGIGNELKGDDGIGNMIAREMQEARLPGWLPIPCGTVPENFIPVIRREKPEILIILDAAEMGISPGEFRIISKENLGSKGYGTHGMPLEGLVRELEKYAPEVIFVGIQPLKMEYGGEGLSPPLDKAKLRLFRILEDKKWRRIKKL
jgi:hydrogenase 3 maturation protease